MKKLLSIPVIFLSMISLSCAQGKQEGAVANAVEQLRKAMGDADSVMLDKLVSAKLSYGHSNGNLDDKTIFIRKLVSRSSDFVTLAFEEQTIVVEKHVAIVRHKLHAKTNDNGKSGEVHLAVLLVWQKQRGYWKLLARQAVKIQ